MTLARLAPTLAFFGGWELVVVTGVIDKFSYSSPTLVWGVLVKLFSDGSIGKHLFATVEEALWGLALGFVAGRVLSSISIPSVLARVFSSLRVTVGFAFTGAIVGEFIASSKGLGYLRNVAQNSFNASLMMVRVVLIMAIMMLLFAILERIEAWAMRGKQQG